MQKPKSTVEILKLLDKSNCRKCGEPTCMAFAAAVFKGARRLDECPSVDPEIAARFSGDAPRPPSPDEEMDKALNAMKKEVGNLDMEARAEALGGRMVNGRLTLKIMGKDFSVDREGALHTDIHVNPWVALPFLTYVLYAEGADPAGEWISIRELKDGQALYGLFKQRTEIPLKTVADAYPDLFQDMVDLFNGREVEPQYQSDVSVVLHPLPKVPIMICYWKPEDGLESSVNIFFDANANRNLSTGALYGLCGGLVRMFEKLALRHGVPKSG